MTRPTSRSDRVRPEDVHRRAGELLQRYRPLVDDWDAFLHALARPKPTCVVANRERIDRAALAGLLADEAVTAEPVPWSPAALRVPPETRPGALWTFLAGLYQVQEEASLLPVAMLDPQPGERVLDLCAAPGGKAAQIALAVGRSGTVVANDKESRRLTAIRDKMKRLGLVNLTTTVHDGADYPDAAGPFDRVLVDAPCSSEGTKFAAGASYLASEREFRHWIAGQQAALLRRAARLVRPGGRIVYATCSFAPEENEAVVDQVLAELQGELRPVAVRPEGLQPAPAVTGWGERRFSDAVKAGLRLWPHSHGTGGFFAIALERSADAAWPAAPALDDPGPAESAETILGPMERRFGLPAAAFAGLEIRRRGDHLQASAVGHTAPAKPRPVSTGVPIRRRAAQGDKLSTAAALMVGAQATRNVVELDAAQRDAYQRRQPLTPSPAQLADCNRQGYVILRYRGVPLGCGLLRPGPPVEIESQYPRAWALTS
jgi:16S rRNA C967 or C1407 C5-methylase (RsmB/RsmF family)/NOL1/NOP2/fmu family ribosome biogenesis protein